MKGKKRILVFNSILFAILFLSITFNKEVLRPLYGHIQFAGVIIGSLPNFIAALIISLCFVNGVVTRKLKHERSIVYAISFLVFIILAVEEFKPMWGASTHYDLFDIIASGIGSLMAIAIFEFLVSKRKITY